MVAVKTPNRHARQRPWRSGLDRRCPDASRVARSGHLDRSEKQLIGHIKEHLRFAARHRLRQRHSPALS